MAADSELRERLLRLEDSIAVACQSAGRKRAEVALMAVSKTHPAAAMLAAQELGLALFGENRVQEFAQKTTLVPTDRRAAIAVHLIGHLQSNKATRAVELFDGIDSLDSLPLALRLNSAAAHFGKHLPVLLEIKLSDEPTKTGLMQHTRELDELLERLPDLAHLRVEGLMTIAPLDAGQDETRTCFRALRRLRDEISTVHPALKMHELSMGMSGDFALAIAEGSTRIRVGTSLFGARPKPQS